MSRSLEFSIEFSGRSADDNAIDLYDVSQALVGFQRSLALTTHLVLNGQIITQAPSLKGAVVLARPPEEGSWRAAAVILAGTYAATTAPMNTPLGHAVHSAYDYVISESLGFHVDYEKSLGELYDEHQAEKAGRPRIKQHQLDSLVEKCNAAVTEMHRPIFKTQTAETATIRSKIRGEKQPVGGPLDFSTFAYIREELESEEAETIKGRISSYNSNTYKGRVYVAKEGRPVAFELSSDCRSNAAVQFIVDSLGVNAVKEYGNPHSVVRMRVFRNTSRSGHLKSYRVTAVWRE